MFSLITALPHYSFNLIIAVLVILGTLNTILCNIIYVTI